MRLELDFELQKSDDLLKKFQDIHNYIYANDGLSPQQTLEEFVKLLFIKIADENMGLQKFFIEASELIQIKSGTPSVFFSQRIESLFENTKTEYPDIFDTDERIKLSEAALAFTVNKLQSVSLSKSSGDAKGLAFQKFLAHQEKDGRGQFFTPEPIIDFCVSIIQPKPTDRIIDPACGSGGFLFSALRFIQKTTPSVSTGKIISENLFGLDINKSIARIAKMKMLLEVNTSVNIICTNALEDLNALDSRMQHKTSLPKAIGHFDVVLTNPPFGTVGKITNEKLLAQYDLGYKWTEKDGQFFKTKTLANGQVAEILFIERCLSLLREGGKLGIVLPNGHFENSSLDYLRAYIKSKARLLGIVSLPPEAFIPYGTGVKTSLLFLEKDSAKKEAQYAIFFGKVKKLGYQGNKNGAINYKKDQFGQILRGGDGQAILDEDFSQVVQDYLAFEKYAWIETAQSFSLKFHELNGRFDYDYYAPENRQLLRLLENANAMRLGDLVEIVKTKSKKLSQPQLVLEYVELSDINTHAFEIINSTSHVVHELPSRASYELKTGDIITAVAGNSIGSKKQATALVTEEFDGCICTNGFRVMRHFKIDPYYLLYFFKTKFFLMQMMMYRTGAAIPSISDTDFANILVQLPPESKIKEISAAVKLAFDLRTQSRKELENIRLEIA